MQFNERLGLFISLVDYGSIAILNLDGLRRLHA
jgi:hypothetical protein